MIIYVSSIANVWIHRWTYHRWIALYTCAWHCCETRPELGTQCRQTCVSKIIKHLRDIVFLPPSIRVVFQRQLSCYELSIY